MRKASSTVGSGIVDCPGLHGSSEKGPHDNKDIVIDKVSSSVSHHGSSKLESFPHDMMENKSSFQNISKDQAIFPKKSGLNRSPMRIPTLAMIERRISTDFLDIAGRLEGLKPLPQLVKDLNRETSNYRNLAVGLGGSSDCEQLREELRKSRQHATDLARQAKSKILPCLQDPNKCSSAERKEAKRLCKLLFYCIKVLEQELERTLALQNSFQLREGQSTLINTGVNEYASGHKGPFLGHRDSLSGGSKRESIGSCGKQTTGQRESLSTHRLSLSMHREDKAKKREPIKKVAVEPSEVQALHKEAFELWSLLHKSNANPVVKCLSLNDGGDRFVLQTIVEDADQSSSPASPLDLLESDQESIGDSARAKLHHKRCLCWILVSLITTLVVASLLGALISFLAS